MYASVIGVMLPGSSSSLVFAARLTLAELTNGGSVLPLCGGGIELFRDASLRQIAGHKCARRQQAENERRRTRCNPARGSCASPAWSPQERRRECLFVRMAAHGDPTY